ncbi:MAG: DNA-binding GntR family transcriptional regulator [Verrucomicrobiales bacterium]|jgi:DNA-binding GntR family transcriptional regulator
MTDALVETLRASILAGDFDPGEHLRQSELAEQYGVSRIPMRDALSRLAADGLIVFDQHRNARVVVLVPHDVREVYAIRLALEPMAAHATVSRIDAASAKRLVQLSEMMDFNAKDPELGPSSRRTFYDVFYAESGLTRIHAVIMRMRDEITLYHRTSTSPISESHETLRRCIIDRDADHAEKVVALHLTQARDDLIESLQDRLTTAKDPE